MERSADLDGCAGSAQGLTDAHGDGDAGLGGDVGDDRNYGAGSDAWRDLGVDLIEAASNS